MTGRCLAALLLLASAGAGAQGLSLPPVERVELDNGAVLILNEKHDVPMIAIHAMLRGGSVTDPDGKAGLAQLYTTLVSRGAGERDGNELAAVIDGAGATFDTSVELEATHYTMDFLARDADLMIGVLADVLRRPTLDRSEFASVRTYLQNTIAAARDSDARPLVPVYGAAFLFGDHPYGRPVTGDETTLAAITHRDVLGYQRDHVGADRLTLIVSGDFDAAVMRDKLVAAFADWTAAEAPLPDVPAPAQRAGGQVLLVDKPGAAQTYFWIGNVGVARSYEHPAELALANILFGGRFTSMLNYKLRTESGLTYHARSYLEQPAQPGSVAIFSYTRTATTFEAIDMALGVLGRLHDSGVDAAMVESARNYFLGQFPPDIETAPQLAAMFADIELYGLGDDYVDRYIAAIGDVDVASIAAVIGEVYPQRDELVFVILGDADAIRDGVTKYGSVTELSITEPRFSP
ncbi:MAG: pitrilysin family protein [Woeseiaceae bacterium]|nr:pitrilysin family protein [Woeseiaceae bacterium]